MTYLFALVATIGLQAETNVVTTLPPVIVYASRTEQKANGLPERVQVFGADDIRLSGARDVTELLEKKGNIHIRSLNANPLETQIAMRGFGENSFGRVKVLIDGEEINTVDMSPPDLSRLPLDSIARVEILHGPNPVLYGDGAVASVINITTHEKDYARKTSIEARAGSYDTYGAHIRTKGGLEEEGLCYSASYGYDTSDGYRNRSNYDLHAVSGALYQDFSDGSYIGLRANYSAAFYELPGALTYAQWKDDPRQSTNPHDSSRQHTYATTLDSKLVLDDNRTLYVDGTFSMRRRTTSWGNYGYSNAYDLYTGRGSIRYVDETPLFDFGNRLTLGTDLKCDREYITDRSGYGAPAPDFYRLRPAFFAHDAFSLSDTLSFIAGARLEGSASRWNEQVDLAESHTCDWNGDFELGLVYRPIDPLKFFLKGTRFHRSAFCDELIYTQDSAFLKPETGSSLDLGAEWAFDRETHFDITGYWMVMEDEIFYNPHAAEYAPGYWGGYNCNSPSPTSRIGFDANVTWRHDKVAEAAFRYAFVDARFWGGQYDGDTVPLVPQNRVRAEAGVWIFSDLELLFGCRALTSQVLSGDYDNTERRLPFTILFDLALKYTPSWAPGWKASFTLDNLLDRDYCDFAGWSSYSGAYYYPACGRSFLFSLSYTF